MFRRCRSSATAPVAFRPGSCRPTSWLEVARTGLVFISVFAGQSQPPVYVGSEASVRDVVARLWSVEKVKLRHLIPVRCLDRCDTYAACMLLGCRDTRPSNVTTNNLTSSEIELQARELLDRNVSRQVRRRIARKGL